MTKNETLTLHFILRNETPGAVRYQQIDEAGNKLDANNGGLIGTLYLRKSELPEGSPKRLIMNLEALY